MEDMREVYAVSIELLPEAPGASLLASWYLEELRDAGFDFWVMLRWGVLRQPEGSEPFAMTPPPGTATRRVLYMGSPIGAIEMANRTKRDGLSVDLLAVGITENTPPVSPRMLANVEKILAPPETAQWLRTLGVDRVHEIAVPWKAELGRSGDVDKREGDPRLHIVWEKSVPNNMSKIPFPTSNRPLVWRDDGVPADPEDIATLVRWADVYVARAPVPMDDPIKAAFATRGVLTVDMEPLETFPRRLIEAGSLREAGAYVSSTSERHGGADIQRALSEDDPDEPEVFDVTLGVVIPFGYADTAVLEDTLQATRNRLPDGTPIIVAHQWRPDLDEKIWAAEEDEVKKLCRLYAAKHVQHSSPSGWRLGMARNRGVEALPPGVSHVAFVDADTRPSPNYYDEVVSVLQRTPVLILSPFVVDSDGSNVRIGSGTSVYPVSELTYAGGFEETFVGWGFEDLEMLRRMRGAVGVAATPIGSPSNPLLTHEKHEERWAATRATNWDSYLRLRRDNIGG